MHPQWPVKIFFSIICLILDTEWEKIEIGKTNKQKKTNKKLMTKKFPKFGGKCQPRQTRKTWIPGRTNTNGIEPWQKVFTLLYTKDKTKSLKAGREKKRHI